MYSVPALTNVQARQQTLLQQVYGWMAAGLGITATVAWLTFQTGLMWTLLENNLMLPLIIVQFGVVIGMSFMINKISPAVATGLFVLYSALTGLTLSVILAVYTGTSIAGTFVVTAGTFGGMSLYGYTTKRDLSSMGSYLRMAFWGFFLGTIVNMFWANNALYWILTYAGIAIFIGLTAYDTQKIKQIGMQAGMMDDRTMRRAVIMCALTLYLDFINLFLLLLRVMGNRR